MKYLLAIESTCDETAAAVIGESLEVFSSVVASQDQLHTKFGGVVPEVAARAHVERILPVIDEAIKEAGLSPADLHAIAVAHAPGLAGSLMVGLMAAKTLALALDIPLIGINHLQAHIYACRIAFGPQVFPSVGLVVSGGHTSLYRCNSPLEWDLLGGTIDDAAGEAFDKVASMLGLPYPGGPAVGQIAEGGDGTAHRFPRSFMGDPQRLQFSFSGLKTAVRYAITGPGKAEIDISRLTEQEKADLAASFQEAVVDVLVDKSMAALDQSGLNTLCVGGGVAANKRLKTRLDEAAKKRDAELYFAPLSLCTDNAVMGGIAWERLQADQSDNLSLDIVAGLER